MAAQEFNRQVEVGEFAPREVFLEAFSGFVDRLALAETAGAGAEVQALGQEIKSLPFAQEEKELFQKAFDLFCLKNNFPPFNSFPEFVEFSKGEGREELTLEIGGPIAVGKTILAEALAKSLGAKKEEERFKPSENPFLALSYQDNGLMLRTQLKFLLDNILTGLRGKFSPGRWVRDTSVRSDIHVFMEWRRQAGKVTAEEHAVYMKLVGLLEPLIPKPSLLIMLKPNSIENLWQGMARRIEAEPATREMERVVTLADLEIVNQAALAAAEFLPKQYGLNVMSIEIDPRRIYEESDLRYVTVYRIRERLGILWELLTKDPKEAAEKIVSQIFAPGSSPRVVAVHSPSMFAGKTSVLREIAQMVGPEMVLAFQPAAALRYGEDHRLNIMTRDGGKIPAITIESNKLGDIVSYIVEERITPAQKPFIFVDEIMLAHETRAGGAISVIEELYQRGFKLVFTGIDYTFAEEPFTFMHDLLAETTTNPNWKQVEMGTHCKYCGAEALGSRRILPDGSIAKYGDETYQAGDNYEPVCCVEHPSCVDQPEGFVRQPLPTEP